MAKAGVDALIKRRPRARGLQRHRQCDPADVIDTQATRAALPYADYVDWPNPDEIAAVIDFLAAPDPSHHRSGDPGPRRELIGEKQPAP